MLYPLLGMGVDLITPALPAISVMLHVSPAAIKNLISIYLLGYALGNFFIGFISDAKGRHKLALLGFIVFTAVSLMPTIFANMPVLFVSRFLQGVALGAFAVIARAILSDTLSAEKFFTTAPLLATAWALGPIIGPMIGGYLQYYWSWQACFYFFTLYAMLGISAFVFVIPETHLQKKPLKFKKFRMDFIAIATHHLFMGLIIAMGIAYALLIVFNTLGPFFIQTQLGHTSVYFGHVAFWMGVWFLICTLISRQLVKKIPIEKVLSFAVLVPFLLILIFLGCSYFYLKSIYILMAATLCVFGACGVIYPACMAKGISLFRHMAGSASAIMHLVNILITSVIAFAISFISPHTVVSLLILYACLLFSCIASFYLLICKKKFTCGQ